MAYWVLLGFSRFFLWFTVFYCVLLGFTGFFIEFYRGLLGFTVFFKVLLGCTGFYWVVLGCTGFYWVFLGNMRSVQRDATVGQLLHDTAKVERRTRKE